MRNDLFYLINMSDVCVELWRIRTDVQQVTHRRYETLETKIEKHLIHFLQQVF